MKLKDKWIGNILFMGFFSKRARTHIYVYTNIYTCFDYDIIFSPKRYFLGIFR